MLKITEYKSFRFFLFRECFFLYFWKIVKMAGENMIINLET